MRSQASPVTFPIDSHSECGAFPLTTGAGGGGPSRSTPYTHTL